MQAKNHCGTGAEGGTHQFIRIEAFRAKRLTRAGDNERGAPHATQQLKRLHAGFSDQYAVASNSGIEWTRTHN
jgi:hypothetical protein